MIIAIDPGITTGMAVERGAIQYGQVAKSPREVYELLRHAFSIGVEAVVIEDYNGQLISAEGIATVRLIGGIEALCWHWGVLVVIQFPGERVPFKPAAKKVVESFGPDTRHAIDAMAHLLLYKKRRDEGVLAEFNQVRRKIV